jgi:hypothetical protein
MSARHISTVDVKCWDLAQHFLADVPGHTKEQAIELAGVIQQAIEDHLPGIEEAVAEDRRNNGQLGAGA